jgi:plastocyanin domain-containing protein
MRHTLIARIGYVALILALPVVPAVPATAVAAQEAAVREIEIIVDGGYSPARVEVKKGERVRLKFLRKEYTGCTREVVIPALKVRQELPPNKAVIIDLPALDSGEYEFRCGMNMIRGAIVVLPG